MIPTAADFKFPVLGFTPDKDLWGFPDWTALSQCGPKALKENMQAGMELVDAKGRRWKVRSVRRLGAAMTGLAWLVEPLLYGKRTSRIEYDLEPLPPVDLDEVKARITAGLHSYPEFYRDGAEGDDDDESKASPILLAKVARAKRIGAFHEMLGLDDFRAY